MGDFIQNSIRDGSLVMFHDYRSGTALDWSGNGNHGTLPPDTTIFTGRGLRVFSVNPAQAITVPNLDFSNTAECSWIWKSSCIGEPFNTCFIWPSNWTTSITSVFIGSITTTKRVQMTTKGDVGYNTWYTASNDTPPRAVFGASFNKALPGNQETRGFINGVLSGATVVTPNNTNNFGVNTLYAGKSATTPYIGNIEGIMAFNRALTADEHLALYRELI